ncbi:MAG: RHS repeat-associated core domain-containing protein [Opitutaceae bacterium]
MLSANNGTNWGEASRISVIRGHASVGDAYTSHGGYDIEDVRLIGGKSTMSTTIRDHFARVRRIESHVWSGGAWHLVGTTDFEYNSANQLTSRTSSNGGVYTAAWSGEHKLWEQDETGVKITFAEYDAAGRMRVVTREAAGDIPALSTRYSYDAAHRIREIRAGWQGSPQSTDLVTTRNYDDAGRISDETPPGLGKTEYTHAPSARTRTVKYPDDNVRTETFFPDGQMQSVTGEATVEEHYTYEVQPGGTRYTRVNVGSSSSPRLREAWSDWLGRVKKTSRPGWPGQPASVAENFYDDPTVGMGRLFKTSRTGYAPTRYAYDDLGQLTRSGLDLGDNGLVLSSSDRITGTNRQFEYFENVWWLREETKVYPFTSDSSLSISVSRMRLTGHPSGRLAETRLTDAEGNTVTRTVDVDRTTRTVTITTSQPGLDNHTETIVNGFTTSATGRDGLTFTTTYDALLRTQSVTDPRTGATTTTYHAGSTLPKDVTGPAGLLYSCAYDELGRKSVATDAAGKKTRYEYNERGQLFHQWGDGAYPVEYGYDATYGDRTSVSTYRAAPDTDSMTWPTVGAADTTTSTYEPATGLLSTFALADGNSTVFRYNDRGQLAYRSWVRRRQASGAPQYPNENSAVITRYAYDSATGELTGRHYNDNGVQTADEVEASDPAVPEACPTADISYTYTRLGQLKTVTDATGTRTFQYDATKPWRLEREELGGFFGNRWFSRLYETGSIVGREAGFQLGVLGNLHSDTKQLWYYQANTGRVQGVQSSYAGQAFPFPRTFVYGYKLNSNLLEDLTIVETSGNPSPFSVTRTPKSDRDLPETIDSRWLGASVARYDCTYINVHRRETAKQSGTAFGDYGEPTFVRYTYNPRGELTDAPAYLGSTVTDTSRPLVGRQYEYKYDSIGNRTSSNHTGNEALKEAYFGDEGATQPGANGLNQYRRKQNRFVPVQGTVDSVDTTAAVKDVPSSVARQGRYWAVDAEVDNTSGPWAGTITTYAARVGGGSGGADLVATEDRPAHIAARAQPLNYDADGNLTDDGIWTYTWDAENRLVCLTRTSAAVAAGFTNQKIEFTYDYLGRRVQKRLFAWNGSGWTSAAGWRFIYDGWNLVAEYDATNGSFGALERTFAWGLDVAGSSSATGGVGALLEINDRAGADAGVYYPAYDAGGNVAALVTAGGTLAATYEYSPFGELLRARGLYAKQNPFRFSTRFHDEETGLIYYGHRYYAPGLGRFVNRDPLGIAGGLNLYGFVANDSINGLDVLGLNLFQNVGRAISGFFGRIGRIFGGGGSDYDNPGFGGGDGDLFFEPHDPWAGWDEDFGEVVPDYPSRTPGAIVLPGPLPRRPFASVAQRANSPYDIRQLTTFHANAANSEVTNGPSSPPGRITIEYETFIPFPTVTDPFGRVFKGDDRTPQQDGTSRTTHIVVIDLDSKRIISAESETGVSHQLDPKTGEVIRKGHASRTAGFEAGRSPGTTRDGSVVFYIRGSSGNPIASVVVIPAPKIDYKVAVVVSPEGAATIYVRHDGFPAHMLSVNGQPVHIFEPESPKEAISLFDLGIDVDVTNRIELPAPTTP